MGGPSKLGFQQLQLPSSASWQDVKNELATLSDQAKGRQVVVDKAKDGKPTLLVARSASGTWLDRVATSFKAWRSNDRLLTWARKQFTNLTKDEVKSLVKQYTPGRTMTASQLTGLVNELALLDELAPSAKQSKSVVTVVRSGSLRRIYGGHKQLGSGGQGMVHLMKKPGEPHEPGKPDVHYAVKSAKDGAAKGLASETAIHKKLMLREHSHIVDVVDDFVDQHGQPALILEAMEDSVKGAIVKEKQWLAQVQLDEKTHASWRKPAFQKNVFQQMALGVQQVHAQGMAHGDIKPENFLVRRTDAPEASGLVVKIADFGSAWDTTDPQSKWNGSGSSQYAAPEMSSGPAAEVGQAADVFALGLTALAVFGLRDNGLYRGEGTPDKKEEAVQFLALLTQDAAEGHHVARLADIGVTADRVKPAALFDLLTRMLHPNPLARPTIDEVLGHAFFTDPASFATGKQEVS